MTPLDPAALAAALAALPGWAGDGGGLTRTWRFPSFRAAIAWMAAVAEDIDRAGHHPEWSNVYDRVAVRLRTHDAGDRVTARDVALATLIDRSAHAAGAV
jgi:4a-hydroxytetrahydrobiopterin dehydratase